jgi:hypothetical protein
MSLKQLFTSTIDNEILLNMDMAELYKGIWVNSGIIFVPEFNTYLIEIGYNIPITEMADFDNDSAESLGEIFTRNQSDKSTFSNYHILYSYIFNLLGKESPLQILEFGLDKRPGGSLYAFREYLPNANMCGTSPDADILFQDERIKTVCVDQYILSDFMAVPNALANTQFDLIIQNGDNSITTMLNTMLFALNNLNNNGWIVVEDILVFHNWRFIDFMLNDTKLYKTYMIRSSAALMYVIHKLP